MEYHNHIRNNHDHDNNEDQEELLSLNLALNVGNYHRKRKRNILLRRSLTQINTNNNNEDNFEKKVIKLLQMRDQMLKNQTFIFSSPSSHQDHDHDHHDDLDHYHGLRLIHHLLTAAAASSSGDSSAAITSLTELYSGGASLTGDAVQRVSAHFADGLVARILSPDSTHFAAVADRPTAAEEFSGFIEFYRASPIHQFAHFTANQAIVEAFDRDSDSDHRALHVIDFEVSFGFQWPSLIQSLAEKASNRSPISLRITGLCRNHNELRETEDRLSSFAKPFENLIFEFRGLVTSAELFNCLKKRRNEAIAVNVTPNVSDETLRRIREILEPSVTVLVERDRSSRHGFLPRFMDSLHYFAAVFDSLDAGMPRGSAGRLVAEKNHLGREIKEAMAIENGGDHEDELIRERMLKCGFGRVGISSKALIQAKLLVKMRGQVIESNNGGFRVLERDEGMAVSLAWQNKCLVTVSLWN